MKFKVPPHSIYKELMDLLKELLESIHYKNMKADFIDLEAEKKSQKMIQEFVKSHTQVVRNWGSFSQVKQITSEIYSKFDEELQKNYNYTCNNLIEFFQYLIDETERLQNLRIKMLADVRKSNSIYEMLEKYFQYIDNDISTINELIEKTEFIDIEDTFLYIVMHADLLLPNIFIFDKQKLYDNTAIEPSSIDSILENFSYSLGDLEETNKDYIYLDNPIWNKPIIKTDEYYFCLMPQMFFSFILKILDSKIDLIDGEKLRKTKADYLETKVESVVKSKFPELLTILNFKWKDGKTQYESDLIDCIDSYIIIFEVKSHKITDAALRGAPSRLKKKIKEILVEPNIQSNRLKEKILYLKSNPNIDDSIRKSLPISINEITQVLRVSVTLEYFASIQSNIMNLKSTGWVPKELEPCPTMNISDFEIIFDLLDHPVEIINYLDRRVFIESNVKYTGDEYDLLGLYTLNNLNLADVNPELPLFATNMSKEIDIYYESKEAGVRLQKPKPKINKFFRDIVNQLGERKPTGWTYMGNIIYSLWPKDQAKFIKYVSKVTKNILRRKAYKQIDNMVIYKPPHSAEYSICYFVFNNKNKENRYNIMDDAAYEGLESEYSKACLVIGKNVDNKSSAYDIIGVYPKHENNN